MDFPENGLSVKEVTLTGRDKALHEELKAVVERLFGPDAGYLTMVVDETVEGGFPVTFSANRNLDYLLPIMMGFIVLRFPPEVVEHWLALGREKWDASSSVLPN